MLDYKLINNHYIVDIDGKNYLIDTGHLASFWVNGPMAEVTIDGRRYRLGSKPTNLDVEQTNALVGVRVDGFIGMDIISTTGLTIYKSGIMEFDVIDIPGEQTPMSTHWPLMVKARCGAASGTFIIDTGAKYAYGIPSLFAGRKSCGHVHDYNPDLGKMESDLFSLYIVICGKEKTIAACDEPRVGASLSKNGSILIGNVSSLFEDACVLDTKKGRLILK